MKQTNPGDHDTIQLFEDAVQHLLPSYADEDDMYEALNQCGMTQRQIFDAVDRRLSPEQLEGMPEEALASIIVDIIYENFAEALADATVHKAPLQ